MKKFFFIMFLLLSPLGNKIMAQNNFISNGNFDVPVSTTLQNETVSGQWSYLGGWNIKEATVKYLISEGINNSPCISIIGGTGTVDVRLGQKIIGLDRGKQYICTAKIKTIGVQDGTGARISHQNSWQDGVKGSSDWQTYSLEYMVSDISDNGTAEVWLRLGGYGATSKGICYFDDISFTEVTKTKYNRTSDHFTLIINPNEKSVNDAEIDIWLSNLDKMYKQYQDLMSGLIPYEGKIVISSVHNIPVWAWTTSTKDFGIQWNSNFIAPSLLEIVNYKEWSFGIMHEIAHNFGSIGTKNNAYNWNEEEFANIRMYLALIKTNGVARLNNTNYIGMQIVDYFYNIFLNNNLITNDNKLNHDAHQYTLCRLGNKYEKNGDHGYELFKCAFKYIFSNPAPIGSANWNNWQRHNYFMDILSKCAGEDVRVTFSQKELSSIQLALGGGTTSTYDKISNDFVIYPNPTRDILNISGISSDINVVIFDMLGKQHFNGNLINNSIDVSSLSKGIYLINVDKKIVKFVKI